MCLEFWDVSFSKKKNGQFTPSSPKPFCIPAMSLGEKNNLAHFQCFYLNSIKSYGEKPIDIHRSHDVIIGPQMTFQGVTCASGVSAASGLLGKPGTYQKSPGSWDLRYPLPKTEMFADLVHYLSGVTKFCVKKIQHRTWEPQCQVWTGLSLGKFPSKFQGSNPGGESSPLSPVVNTPMTCAELHLGHQQ